MRHVRFDPSTLDDPRHQAFWLRWLARADAATQEALEAWETWAKGDARLPAFTHAFNKDIWGHLKEWLAAHVFRMKCAYCESGLDLDRYHGDAEHFRPKGRVTINDDSGVKTRPRCTLPDRGEVEHPGYFWLAYNWRNLLPACTFCNSRSGKVDQFPAGTHVLLKELTAEERAALPPEAQRDMVESRTWPGWYLLGPVALDKLEQPHLLNPLNPEPDRAPREHLRFGLNGTVVAVDDSLLGRQSISTYKLNRSDLMKRRWDVQADIVRIYQLETMTGDATSEEQRLTRVLAPFMRAERDYSTAALDYLNERLRLRDAHTKAALSAHAD